MRTGRRPLELRRSWLFLPGADQKALLAARESAADVLIQELEDFVPPNRKEQARALAVGTIGAWKAARRVAGVRVNPLIAGGLEDLEACMPAGPDVVLLPKTGTVADVLQLAGEIDRLEQRHKLTPGSTEIVPNIESAAALLQVVAIARCSPRVVACLLASEDMAADLGAERGRDAIELAYARQRFLVDCRAARVVAIDCPYTWRDQRGLETDTRWARRLGYRAKSAVLPEHCAAINDLLTPSREEIERSRATIAAFERAQAAGAGAVAENERMVETPIYRMARRIIDRARAFGLVAD
ncbi:MAG: CoA ester lyase [Alphaproteobacteria bacterium]|nr:CoA ester lyase [Alphaproteobacteria bacterium]